MSLFELGNFILSSGAKSCWKIECDALSAPDIGTLAVLIAQMVGPFASVEGVPRGGLRLAEALRPFRTQLGCHLIVDDVLTTGGSLERHKAAYASAGSDTFPRQDVIIGAVVFARGPCPPWIKAVFQLSPELWLGKE